MNMYDRMKEINPTGQVICTAIDELVTSEDMRSFVMDCIEHYRVHGNNLYVREHPEEIVKKNISYLTGNYDSETADRWMKEFEDLSHPFFGREIPFNDSD